MTSTSSLLATLFSLVGLGWYTFIWALCLFGLHRARLMFLNHDTYDSSSSSSSSFSHSSSSSTDDRRQRQRQPKRKRQDASLPGVSVLRPLAGEDSNLFANLASTFLQDYPRDQFEVIFSLSSPNDPALPIARAVVDHYSPRTGVKAHIIIGAISAGVNPKINNLLRPYCRAQHDLLWIVDSQVRLCTGTLRSFVGQFLDPPPTPSPTWLHRKPHGPRVGLVHAVPLGIDHHPSRLASLVERVFLSTTHAKMYLAMNAFAIDSCVMGKSNLWRKSDLERVPDSFFAVGIDGSKDEDPEGAIGSRAFQVDQHRDGGDAVNDEEGGDQVEEDGDTLTILRKSRPLARFSIYLAEDNMVATSLWRPPLSLAHVVAKSSACIARTNVGDIRTLSDYIGRRSRWIRVRRHMVPEATYIEPFTESILAGIVGFFSLTSLGYWPKTRGYTLLFFLLHFVGWYLLDFAVLAALESGEEGQECLGIHDGHEEEEQEEEEDHDHDHDHDHDGRIESSVSSTTDIKAVQRTQLFKRKGERWQFTKAWVVREVLALPIWCFSVWAGDEVNWRGQPYRILSDSRAAHIVSPTSSNTTSSTSTSVPSRR